MTKSVSAEITDRSHMFELEEQLKLLKEDNKVKDDLIRALSSMEVKEVIINPNRTEPKKMNPDISQLESKCISLKKQLKEKESEVESLRQVNRETMIEIEITRGGMTKQTQLVESLMKQLDEAQTSQLAFDKWKVSNEAVLETQQKYNEEAYSRIQQLEDRISQLTKQRETTEQEKGSIGKKFAGYFSQTLHLLGLDEDASASDALTKLGEIVQDNASMRSRITNLLLSNDSFKSEKQDNEESMTQLIKELNKVNEKSSQQENTIEDLKKGISQLTDEKRLAVANASELQKKYETADLSLKAMTCRVRELELNDLRWEEQKQKNLCDMEGLLKQHQVFMSALSSAMGNTGSQSLTDETSVLDRVRMIVSDNKEKLETITMLELQMKKSTTQGNKKGTELRCMELELKSSEAKVLEQDKRIRELETELEALSVGRNLFMKTDREKSINLAKRLSSILKIESSQFFGDLDSLSDVIVNKVDHHLLSCDSHLGTLRVLKSQQHEFTEKLKELETELKIRDEKLFILERHVKRLDPEFFEKVYFHGSGKYKEDHLRYGESSEQLNSKLHKLLQENAELRMNKCLQCSCRAMSRQPGEESFQRRSLELTIDKLERVRQKQAQKVQELCSELRNFEVKLKESNEHIKSLENQCKDLKSLLVACQRRENQLSNLRVAIGTMLGLQVETLAIPDFEILSRLESLVMSGTPLVPKEEKRVPSIIGSSTSEDFEDVRRLLIRPTMSPNRTRQFARNISFEEPDRRRGHCSPHSPIMVDDRKY